MVWSRDSTERLMMSSWVCWAWFEFGLLHRLGDPQDPVHGGAQFVAHGRQKAVLGLLRQPRLRQLDLQLVQHPQAPQGSLVEDRQHEDTQQQPHADFHVALPVGAEGQNRAETQGPQDDPPLQELLPETDAVADDDPQE